MFAAYAAVLSVGPVNVTAPTFDNVTLELEPGARANENSVPNVAPAKLSGTVTR